MFEPAQRPPPIVKEVKLDAKTMWYLRNISVTATIIRYGMWLGLIFFVVGLVISGSK